MPAPTIAMQQNTQRLPVPTPPRPGRFSPSVLDSVATALAPLLATWGRARGLALDVQTAQAQLRCALTPDTTDGVQLATALGRQNDYATDRALAARLEVVWSLLLIAHDQAVAAWVECHHPRPRFVAGAPVLVTEAAAPAWPARILAVDRQGGAYQVQPYGRGDPPRWVYFEDVTPLPGPAPK